MYSGNQFSSNNPYTPQKPQHSRHPSQAETMSGSAPNINLQQSTPQGSQMNSPAPNVPESLQPGLTSRGSSFTSPTLPSMGQNPGQQQHYMPPPRPGVLGSSHSHSKSSPIGLDQKYVPFSSTTPTSASSMQGRLYAPQTPTGSSYSPLGLSDIRPNMGADVGGDFSSPTLGYETNPIQTNSNYQAPWATYAYDWCKWPVSGSGGCGKMALGSYLEDPHNFVSDRTIDEASFEANVRRSKFWIHQ